MMPPGLVERLTEMHHSHSESLRDAVMSIADQEANAANPRLFPAAEASGPMHPQAGSMFASAETSGPMHPQAGSMFAAAGQAPTPTVDAPLFPSAQRSTWVPMEKRPQANDARLRAKVEAHSAGADMDLDKSILLQAVDG